MQQQHVFPSAQFGGKAHHLARLTDMGVAVPTWTAIPPDEALDDHTKRVLLTWLSRHKLQDSLLAVRSSATVEDSAAASYAGQFLSILGVRAGLDGEALWAAIKAVRSSANSDHVRAYQKRHGDENPIEMAVVVQRMIAACVSGVAFSVDPVSGVADVVISAVYGLGEGLVSGDLDADTYRVTPTGHIERTVAVKDRALLLQHDGGSVYEPVSEAKAALPALTDEEARQIAEAARFLEERFGAPQDVEWALDDDRQLWILQTRPVTTLQPDPNGELAAAEQLWDNSNIVESYGGVASPLTYSFARYVYEQVYRQLCSVLGVSNALLDDHRDVFAHMLGSIRGRVYYNLLNWYRALALLPGYSFNRAFMERMMGVREKLQNPPETPYAVGKAADLFRLIGMVGRLVREQVRLPAEVRRFHARVDAILLPLASENLDQRSLDDLAGLYRRLERELLEQWRAPLVNDFLAMIYFGVLGRLVEKWLPGAPPTLVNDLLVGEGGIISTQPAERITELAKQVRKEPSVEALFLEEPDDRALWERLLSDRVSAALRRDMEAYCEQFGDRCGGELKLETITPRQEPWRVAGMVRTQLPLTEGARSGSGAKARVVAESYAETMLTGLRLRFFRWALRQTRARVRDRENLRFERTRVFGLTRRVFLAIGAGLTERRVLRSPRDVFFLTREEILGYLDGSCPTADLVGLVALRQAEQARWSAEAPLPDRFKTQGPPNEFLAAARPAQRAAHPDAELTGTGCCPGVVRAPVRIVHDPGAPGELAGRIMVAERTDPGWTLLFPAAAGLLVQRGSLLSHSAIVAREVGLPCVVGIANLLDTLEDGEWVEMDGARGTVKRVGADG